VTVRPARAEDREFVLAVAGRLSEFGVPPWRTADEIVAGEVRVLAAFFEAPPEGAAMLVAEDSTHGPLGFAYLETQTDFFTRRRHSHLGVLAVSREAEGRGAAGALLSAAEAWARSRGHGMLTLNVFADNRHARDVYDRRGFSPETVRYVKSLE
jgi:GNAT superfamily N-acetyltransferase